MAYQFSKSKDPKPAQSIINQRPTGHKSDATFMRSLITIILLVVIIGGGLYLISSYTGFKILGGGDIVVNADWQAVFLDNGQVYFGKISKVGDQNIILKNIYYLQVVDQPLQRSQQGEVIEDQVQPEQRLTLIKLGNEIHGPKDEMTINREHVILVEDLRSDSRVVQAINDYLSGGPAQN